MQPTSIHITYAPTAIYFVEVEFFDGSRGFRETSEAQTRDVVLSDLCSSIDDKVIRIIGMNVDCGICADVTRDFGDALFTSHHDASNCRGMSDAAKDLCERAGYDVDAEITNENKAQFGGRMPGALSAFI